jgi:hypothetical protein
VYVQKSFSRRYTFFFQSMSTTSLAFDQAHCHQRRLALCLLGKCGGPSHFLSDKRFVVRPWWYMLQNFVYWQRIKPFFAFGVPRLICKALTRARGKPKSRTGSPCCQHTDAVWEYSRIAGHWSEWLLSIQKVTLLANAPTITLGRYWCRHDASFVDFVMSRADCEILYHASGSR